MDQTKILIVDDKQSNLIALRAVLGKFLDDQGNKVQLLQADSGKKCLELLKLEPVDLILLDVQMPIMDGYETARLICENPQTSQIPILFVSAVYNDEFHMQQAYEQGAIDFISKPFNPEFLKAKIISLLRVQRSIRRALVAEREKENIVEVSQMKAAFLKNMNHEMRTPMNGILAMIDLLLSGDNRTPDDRECLLAMRHSGNQMLHIVENILDIACLEADRLALEPTEFNLASLVKEVTGLYQFQVNKKGVAFVIAVDPLFQQDLLGDKQRIKQILMNLLSNSVAFTEKGQITISVTSQAIKENDMTVAIRLEDTGIGIDPAKKALLFQLFSQGDLSATKRHQGLGLGLIIVKRLVELMHGSISWDSTAGQGSWFELTIPLQLAPTKASTQQQGETRQDVVLVVEDDPVEQKIISRMIKKLGYASKIASSTAEALSFYQENKNLHGKDHLAMVLISSDTLDREDAATLKDLRHPEIGQAPVIIMTSEQRNNFDLWQDRGATAVLLKPITLEPLQAELERHAPH